MSISDLETAFILIEKNFLPDELFFDGHKSNQIINIAEKNLGIDFPKTYKLFLSHYGFGGFSDFDIDGVTDYKHDNSEFGGVVWNNLYKRNHFNFPHHLISIYDVGEGTTYCLDTSQMNEDGECPVVVWPLNDYEDTPILEIVAPDFGKFFLDLVERQISYKNENF